MSNRIELIPIKVDKKTPGFNIVEETISSIKINKEEIFDGDILAISSKFVAIAENRVVDLSDVKVSEMGKKVAKELDVEESVSEIIVRESDLVFSGVKGVVLVMKNHVLTPNAGIDRSNIYPGHAVLYPKDPFISAETIRESIKRLLGRKIAVVLTDSRLMPTRLGTTGVAVGVAGIIPSIDDRGRVDLFGNVIKLTQRAIADDISSAAQLIMGEADEGIPIVIIRGSNIDVVEEKVDIDSLAVDNKECIYIRGLTDSDLVKRLEQNG